ncbi:MAG: polysaccharide deacetylase family protein [Candidatus Competibacterales bacterium]
MAQGLSPWTCAALRGLGRFSAPGGARGRLSILIYHRILQEPAPLQPSEVAAPTIAWHFGLLARCFTVLPLAEAVERLYRKALPPRSVCITFDDGYADNYTQALPLLQRFGLPATVFIASGYLNGNLMWNEALMELIRRAPGETLDLTTRGWGVHPLTTLEARRQILEALVKRLKYLHPLERIRHIEAMADEVGVVLNHRAMMTSEQVAALAAAEVEIGAHTVNHPVLSHIDDAEARREISENRQHLQELTGRTIRFFAYPYGKPGRDFHRRHQQLVAQLGFRAAVTTAWGVSTPRSDPFGLARFSPWDARPLPFGLRLLYNCVRNKPQIPGREQESGS